MSTTCYTAGWDGTFFIPEGILLDSETLHLSSTTRGRRSGHLVFILDLVANVFGSLALSDASTLVVVEVCGSFSLSPHQLLGQTEALQDGKGLVVIKPYIKTSPKVYINVKRHRVRKDLLYVLMTVSVYFSLYFKPSVLDFSVSL